MKQKSVSEQLTSTSSPAANGSVQKMKFLMKLKK